MCSSARSPVRCARASLYKAKSRAGSCDGAKPGSVALAEGLQKASQPVLLLWCFVERCVAPWIPGARTVA